MKFGIVGVGLIGGSLALALRRKYAAATLVGIDCQAALGRLPSGLVDRCHDADDPTSFAEGLRGVQVAFLCAPVRVISAQIALALDLAEVVTDCGSTKRAILSQVAHHPRRQFFVPGHPMAGAPQGGIERARVDLFQGRRWLLCPERSQPDAVLRVETLVRDIGAEPVAMSAEDHDRAVALTSHLPQLLASALVVLAEERKDLPAAGPGFQSSTRVAGGPESMWFDIFATNGDEIASALAALRSALDGVEQALGREPPDLGPALKLLAAARALRTPG